MPDTNSPIGSVTFPPLDVPADIAARSAILHFALYFGDDAAPLLASFDAYYNYLVTTVGPESADHYARLTAANFIQTVRCCK